MRGEPNEKMVDWLCVYFWCFCYSCSCMYRISWQIIGILMQVFILLVSGDKQEAPQKMATGSLKFPLFCKKCDFIPINVC